MGKVLGIDLGTTNSAVAYVDTHESPWRIQVLKIQQIVAPFQVEGRETLPSFHYRATPAEAAPQLVEHTYLAFVARREVLVATLGRRRDQPAGSGQKVL